MFSSIVNAVITVIGAAVLALIGWAVSLSNRVSVLEADKVSLKELIQSQFLELQRRLGAIESKLDRNHSDFT